MNRRVFGWIMVCVGLVLAGCTAMEERQGEGGEVEVRDAQGEAGAGAEGAQAGGAEMGGAFAGRELEDPDSPLAQRVFYFEYDSSTVSEADRSVLMAHADFLSRHPEVSVVVEGHTDERGSREYNLALGERRAKAVEKLLLLQGAAREQLQVISFGEERPVGLAHDESAWRLNRRVELLYSGY